MQECSPIWEMTLSNYNSEKNARFVVIIARILPISGSKQQQEGDDEPCHDWSSAYFVNTFTHTEKKIETRSENSIRKSENKNKTSVLEAQWDNLCPSSSTSNNTVPDERCTHTQ